MPTTYKTPGVVIEEVATLPASVVQVPSAIPAFIGVTATKPAGDSAFYKISSFVEYVEAFGGITTTGYLYSSVKLFYANGGGDAFVCSIANSADDLTTDKFTTALDALRKELEPTLILFPDLVNLKPESDPGSVITAALRQCNELKNRFCIFDVPERDSMTNSAKVQQFRESVGVNPGYLPYGAAYGPWLKLPQPPPKKVAVATPAANGAAAAPATDPAPAVRQAIADAAKAVAAGTPATADQAAITAASSSQATAVAAAILKSSMVTLDPALLTAAIASSAAVEKNTDAKKKPALTTQASTDVEALLKAMPAPGTPGAAAAPAAPAEPTEVPPSGAIAGIYASTDSQRGVWKAPANLSVTGIIGLTEVINDHDQESLNVDADGKSINAIRSFPGKGTLVWGARTLDGNDNEWRYVPVRRLFIMVEESIRRSTAFVVFEPNDAHTWIKVKAMIENFLNDLWRQGALAGSKPEQAYFVNVGLGTTMTAQDILEGRMIINVGMAAVRPAEFVIIRFSHKLQEA